MKLILLTALIFVSSLVLFAQGDDLTQLAKTPAGQRVIAYFAAFNSGDEEKLRAFFTENIAEASLKQRPVDPRMEFHRQLKQDFQTVEIKKIESITESEIKILAQAKTGTWVEFSFAIQSQPPQKIIGMQIEDSKTPPSEKPAVAVAPMAKAEFLKTVDSYLNELISADKFSGVVLVAHGDKTLYSKMTGLADQEKKTPNNLDTKFNLGSINKIFTKIAIGQLIAAGRISLDDKLGKFLPDYSNHEAAEKVTVAQLIAMRSGIGDFFGQKFTATPKTNFRKNSDFIPLFASEPLAFEPGTKNQYSNGGYILLGAIIEKVSGMSYYDYVRENIFKPAGMKDTDSFESDKMPANAANGYSSRNPTEKRVSNIDTRPAKGSAAGGGYSTATDLLKFSEAVRSGKLLIPDDNGRPQKQIGTGVAGGSPGVNAILLVNGQSGYTIIVLSNYDPPSAEVIGTQLRDWVKQIKD